VLLESVEHRSVQGQRRLRNKFRHILSYPKSLAEFDLDDLRPGYPGARFWQRAAGVAWAQHTLAATSAAVYPPAIGS
jgi:hypothetical protein